MTVGKKTGPAGGREVGRPVIDPGEARAVQCYNTALQYLSQQWLSSFPAYCKDTVARLPVPVP